MADGPPPTRSRREHVNRPTLIDIGDMPDFNPDGPQNGTRSVTNQLAYYGPTRGTTSRYATPTVNCATHGAMNCVAILEAGKLWRCLTCNEGAYQPKEPVRTTFRRGCEGDE